MKTGDAVDAELKAFFSGSQLDTGLDHERMNQNTPPAGKEPDPMLAPPNVLQLRGMIKVAMREQVPSMYWKLLAANTLETEIEDRITLIDQTVQMILGAPGSLVEKSRTIPETLQAQSQAWDEALAAGLVFPPARRDKN